MIVIAIIAIIAAIAIPNLLESRVTANEGAASASLKSGIFAGEVSFTGGGYQDRDSDNVGEYGTIGQMSGVSATTRNNVGELRLVTGPMALASSSSTTRSGNGYYFAAYVGGDATATGNVNSTVPFSEGGTVTTAVAATDTANPGEQGFIVVAVPAVYGNTGRRVFCITADGMIRAPTSNTNVANFIGTSNGTPAGDGAAVPSIHLGARWIITGTAAAWATADSFTQPAANFTTRVPAYSK